MVRFSTKLHKSGTSGSTDEKTGDELGVEALLKESVIRRKDELQVCNSAVCTSYSVYRSCNLVTFFVYCLFYY